MRPKDFSILLVDDDEQIVRLLRLLLESRGYYCAIAHSAAQGLARIAAEPIDLIVTDLHMAGGDGIALIDAVRRKSLLPVVVVSGFTEIYSQSVTPLTNVWVTPKPINASALLRRVHACRADALRKVWSGGDALFHGCAHPKESIL